MAKSKLFPVNVKLAVSPKAFFKKMPFRLTVTYHLDTSSWSKQYVQARESNTFVRKTLKSVADKNKLSGSQPETKVRFSWGKVNMYFESFDDMAKVFAVLHGKFTKKYQFEVSLMSETHQEIAKNDEKVIIRQSLYYSKYAWRFQFKPRTPGFTVSALLDLLHIEYDSPFHYGQQIIDEKARIRIGGRYSPTIVYLNDDTDVVVVRMAFSGATITKIVLS